MEEIPVAKFECLNCKHSDYRMSTRELGEVIHQGCPRCGGDTKVTAKEPPDWLSTPLSLVTKHFEVIDFAAIKGRVELEVSSPNAKRSFRSLLSAAKQKGYLPVMRGHEGELRLLMVKYPQIKKGNVLINMILLIMTFLTTFAAGYFWIFNESALHAGLFSSAIMLMLGAHELGHKIAAWRNGVESTLPYFIPAPTMLGTLGAVISVKSPIPTKEGLIEMGAAGPIFGFLVALPLTFIGLMLSNPDPYGIYFGFTPVIFIVLQLLSFGYVPAGINLNPLAFAGWVLMFVTMFNLLPAGQLDGGHIARGLINQQRHYVLTRTLGFTLLISGIFFPELPLWLFGFLIILIFRGHHTGALDDVSKLSKRQKTLAAAAFIVFLLCLPIPIG